MASSTALIGFGLDAVIEVTSAAAVAWRFSGPDHERRERAARSLALRRLSYSPAVPCGFALKATPETDATMNAAPPTIAERC